MVYMVCIKYRVEVDIPNTSSSILSIILPIKSLSVFCSFLYCGYKKLI